MSWLRDRLTPLAWADGLRWAAATLPLPLGVTWLLGWPGLVRTALMAGLYVLLMTVSVALLQPLADGNAPVSDLTDTAD